MAAVFDPDLLEPPRRLRHRIGIDEYYRMSETGVLAPGARVEPIDGDVIDICR